MLMTNAMYATVARDGLSIGLMARDNPTSERPAIFGGSAEGGSETDVVLIARDVFRLNLQLVRGYRTSPALTLAMERGEIEGRAITYSTVQKVMGDWLKEGKLRCLLQFGREARLAGLSRRRAFRPIGQQSSSRPSWRPRRTPNTCRRQRACSSTSAHCRVMKLRRS
jgi:hypothetical protein